MAEERGGIVRARTRYSQIEERLRRALGLAGAIDLDLITDMRPLIVAHDLTRPGNSPDRGRFFRSTQLGNAAIGNTSWIVQVRRDVVITQITVAHAPNAADLYQVMVLDPTTAPANAPTQQSGTWCDQKINAADRPPLFETNGFLADATVYTGAQRIFANVGSANSMVVQTNIHLPESSHLVFYNALGAARLTAWVFEGHVF